MTIESQIEELNSTVKCTIRPSKIAGVGVFALRDIKKGERLFLIPQEVRRWYSVPFERLDELRPEIKQVILDRWPSIFLGSLIQNPNDEIWMCSFVNHGGDNSNYDIDNDSALCDIPANTEITENYCLMRGHKTVYPWLNCQCKI